MAKKRNRFFILMVILVLSILFIFWQNNCLEVSKYLLEYDDLPDSFNGYRIIQISDMHGKTFGSQNSRLSKRIKSMKPDILIATGDMMSSTVNDGKAFLNFLDEYDQFSPVYMCLGNHEQIARWLIDKNRKVDYDDFIKGVKNRGVKVLDNDKIKIVREGSTITLEGLTPELYHYSSKEVNSEDKSLLLKKSYIDEVIGKPNAGFNILMAHNPAYFHEYVSWGADLILSGHVHGGVIQVPFKGGLLSPERVFFPEFDAGLFEEGPSKMVVNRGLGYSVINFRLFNRPEISFIELIKNVEKQ